MDTLRYSWVDGGVQHELHLVPVPGTNGRPFPFGAAPFQRSINVGDFHISSAPVTQALWAHVMGSNPAKRVESAAPVENVSWHHVRDADGFLDRLNAGPVLAAIAGDRRLRFRLPTESEWEYAARGGPHWTDGYTFSGSNNPDEVAWYGRRFSAARRLGVRLLGWPLGWKIFGRGNHWRPSRSHAVATKKPNQLGLYDMSGNVWEWCEDVCVGIDAVPRDGSAALGPGEERRLRGGCHHNWDLHCTASWRYGIDPDAHDSAIGFRVVLASIPDGARATG